MFLDDTACNLASLNLLQFRDADRRSTSPPSSTPCRLWTIVLEISVMMAQFPSKEIAELSYEYRTLGLGYANIGGLLMTSGIPYDSRRGPRHLRRDHRDDDRRRLRHLGRDGGRARRLPRLQANARAHAARHPQPSPRRPWRADGYEGLTSTRCRSTTPPAPDKALVARPRGLGPRRSRSARSTATATPRPP
jgi:ribonucleoside-diphosphate reductase alpha chain